MSLIVDLSFEFIGSEFIDPETFPLVCYKIVCTTYPNQTYGFASPAGLWKFVARVPVGCLDLSVSIDFFALSKLSFKLFVRNFFCLLLNCIYHIYCFVVH